MSCGGNQLKQQKLIYMKTTTKIKTLLVLAISAFFSNVSSAQDTAASNYDQGFRLGIGANVGYAVNDPYKLAVGGDVRLQYDLSQKYSLTLTTGYTNLFVSENDGSDVGFIPAKAGFKAFVLGDSFYVMGEAGAAFAVSNGNSQTSLLLSPSIGYATKYVDVSVHYEHYNDFDRISNNGRIGNGVGQVGVRLAYGFKL
jgi:hypothetical protein